MAAILLLAFSPVASTDEEPGAFACFEELAIPPYSSLARNGLQGSATVTFDPTGKVKKAVVATAFANLRAEVEKYATSSRLRPGYCKLPVHIVFDFVQRGEMVNSPVTTVKLVFPNRVVLTTEPLRGNVQSYEFTPKPAIRR
jgi:hypothetical protein